MLLAHNVLIVSIYQELLVIPTVLMDISNKDMTKLVDNVLLHVINVLILLINASVV